MRIKRIERSAAANAAMTQEETAAVKQVCAQLKAASPGLGQLLQNPNNMTFLSRFFQAIGQNNNAMALLRNSMTTIMKAMEKDQTGTITLLQHV